jgi:chromosome segregation ATPase
LDILGYNAFPLGIDSAPLAEQMLTDLVCDTETIQQYKDQIGRMQQQIDSLENQLEPLQLENTRVSRENYQLHSRLLIETERALRKQNQDYVDFFKLQADKRKLELLNEQSSVHCKELQTTIEALKKRIEALTYSPSSLRRPERIDSEPSLLRKGLKRESGAAPIVRSRDDSESVMHHITLELTNMRSERDSAVRAYEDQVTQINRLRDIVKELTEVRGEFARDEDREATIRLLQHTIEEQRDELEKARVQLAAVAPVSRKRRVGMMVLTHPRTTVSILDDPTPSEESAQKGLIGKESEIAALKETIAHMSVDFAFVHDQIGLLTAEKDAAVKRLLQLGPATSDVIADTSGIKAMQKEMDEMRARYDSEVARRDKQIEQMQALLESRPGKVQCNGCMILEQKLEDLKKASQTEIQSLRQRILEPEQMQALLESRPGKVQCNECMILEQKLEDLKKASQTEIQSLRQRILELQQTSFSPMTPSSKPQPDPQMDKLKRSAITQQNELKECKRKLEEAERKIRAIPDMEERCRTILEQIRGENISIRKDLKSKATTVRSLTEKVTQKQRQIQELQSQLQRAKDDVMRITTRREDPHVTIGRDPTSMVQSLQVRLREKEQECESFEKLLEQTQSQLLPLTETTIPRLKVQIANLQRERNEAIQRMTRLAQLGLYVEQTVGHEEDGSPEVAAFFTLLHQIEALCDCR